MSIVYFIINQHETLKHFLMKYLCILKADRLIDLGNALKVSHIV